MSDKLFGAIKNFRGAMVEKVGRLAEIASNDELSPEQKDQLARELDEITGKISFALEQAVGIVRTGKNEGSGEFPVVKTATGSGVELDKSA